MLRCRIMFILCVFCIIKLCVPQVCNNSNVCGWNAECRPDRRCWCISGYRWSYNEVDCVDSSCGTNCISCMGNVTCTRCVDFMDIDTGQCISQCTGTYHLSLSGVRQGKVCKVVEPAMETLTDVHIAVIFTSCGVVLMIMMLGLCLYCHVRSKKGHFHVPEHEIIDAYNISSSTASYMQERTPDSSLMNGHANHYGGVYTIHPDPHNMVVASVFSYQEKEEFMHRLGELRPHMNTILAMVNEARKKTHSLSPDDPLAKNSRSVVQQLCRVLTLLNRKEPEIMMPTDGIKLIKWTNTILHKYLQTHRALEKSPTSSTPNPKTTELPKLSCYDDNDNRQIVPSASNNNTIPYMGMSRSKSNVSQEHNSNSVMQSPSTSSTQELIISTTEGNSLSSYSTRVVQRQHSTHSVEAPFSTFGYERVTDTESSTTTYNPIPNRRKFSTLPRNFSYTIEETTDAIIV